MRIAKVNIRFYRYFYIGLLFPSLLLFAGIAPTCWTTPALAAGNADVNVTAASIPDLVEKLSPTVVNIATSKVVKDRLGRDMTQKGMGTGFIISGDGYIFTNNHVVDKAGKIKVKLADGKEYEAEIKGRDPATDLALIKINPTATLPHAPLGDSDKVRIGESVFAIGNPLGLDHTITAGIISAKGRVIGAGPYDNFLQTDASINPGNSGGPLCNMAGEVVGINTAIIAQAQGIGFAIPINMAKSILGDLKTSGKITRGWLGVTTQDITEDMQKSLKLKDRKGVLVGNVLAGDAADQAGIKIGDVILEINGKPVTDNRTLGQIVANLPVGSKANIKISRDGKEMTLPIIIAERKDMQEQDAGEYTKDKFGLTVQEVTPEIARFFGLPGKTGVIVTDVKAGGPADEAGLKPRDIILKINNAEISGMKEYLAAMKDGEKGEALLVLVHRAKANFFVTLKKGKEVKK
ncbi:MAG TPA: Do family serine endopeptidase [Smithellaceae bacterium]|nr:Do family serine endopeptidase [Smithellaceae bacterium]